MKWLKQLFCRHKWVMMLGVKNEFKLLCCDKCHKLKKIDWSKKDE